MTVAAGVAALPGFSIEIVFKKTRLFFLSDDLNRKVAESRLTISFCNRASIALWRAVCRADLVHLQNPCPDVTAMACFARKPLLTNIINHTKHSRGLHAKLWKLCLHLATRRFYISDFVRRSWECARIPWPNSHVVFPVCQLSSLKPLPVEERTGFVFIARWIENKGLDTLIEAYALADFNRERWPLKLLGDGPLRSRIVARLRELGLSHLVNTPGFVSEVDKAEFIRRSRFVVIPPNTSEDFGLVALEARHLGIPCLITLDGGVPEAAGQYSLCCQPGDVFELRALLQQAAAMDDQSYMALARAAHASLRQELVTPDFYADTYQSMLPAVNK
ncbi:glycosyltransferase [Cyanobium sp. AMD-g]|uniref:glycosyltransferase n=1 Tax=Cyanobium sp. AMD-g TaxID=2823699 RepID=UPI0020CED078|nr:glycosyltransferase [Cyanobium sp. AMD-g]MCP9929771.1 glycosyltransferase [Cyanobium sp. AMD-g]